VSAWLTEVTSTRAGQTVLVIGHRATFYALEHLVAGVSLHTAVTSAWNWQPGWTYPGVRGRPPSV
jgi:alpha-ribazole phosphatase/probable phosphoglycerate mutase